MKRCPTCQRPFTDDTQKFCPNDGTPLVVEETPEFDPEATVMSMPKPLLEESSQPASAPSTSAPPASAPPTPTPYYGPGPGAGSQPEQSAYQSSTPAPGAPPSPAWPPAPPPQQPYYPQSGMPGGQPAPPWQGGQQQQAWPPGQPPPQQGQWGAGGYYPQQPGQYAPQAAKGQGLSLVTLIIGGLSLITFVLVFGMYQRFIPPDRMVAEVSIYATLVTGVIAVVLGLLTLLSKGRNKLLGIIGLLISIPGIGFFIYILSQYGVP